MKQSILLISNSDDKDTAAVKQALREHGESVCRLDTDRISGGEQLITLKSPGALTLSSGGQSFDLESVKSVWLRRPKKITTNILDSRESLFAQKELQEMVEQLYVMLPHARWVSRPYAIKAARHKFRQLQIAQELGFQTPQTCITNSPAEARSFIGSLPGRAIYKPLKMPGMLLEHPDGRPDLEAPAIPTSLIERGHLKSLEKLDRTGGIFQEYIEKEYELRVTVIGNVVLAARINSQASKSELGMVDSRYDYAAQMGAVAYDLPSEVADRCLKMIKEFELEFGAFDFIKSIKDEYVFLELNPNGQWVWLERSTGLPYIQSMVTLLSGI